ncbi:MAG: aldo/keto reductase [Clostridia bacterium]|nr:aldo/keto reductase [Clostridia bacterium]
MIYRQLGKTGKQASVIGLGCEHLDRKPYEQAQETIAEALDHGINILDVFMPGREVREYIAKALGNRRNQVMIQGHIGATDVNQQYDISRDMPTVQRYFEDMLRLFGGHIELGMMFFIDSDKDYSGVFDCGIADYVQKLKQQGDIGHIGFSSHNPATAMRVLDTGLPELVLFSINPAFDLYPAEKYTLDTFDEGIDASLFRGLDPQRAALYTRCEQLGVGITVMKALGAGKLLSPEHTPFAKPLTACQCIHYALTRPAVSSVLLGCQTGAEMLDALQYLKASDAERDYAPALGALRNDFRGHCVYCSHCQPCPVDIDIAAVNKYLDIARLDTTNIPPSIRSHYASLVGRSGGCIACGHCEERCPFGVPVIANMAEAEGLLR